MQTVQAKIIEIAHKTRAIVCFGPATPTTGFHTGDYYQVVIDPEMQSPGGEYIRFDTRVDDNEIHGWQRIRALTVCEILAVLDESKEHIIMQAIVKE